MANEYDDDDGQATVRGMQGLNELGDTVELDPASMPKVITPASTPTPRRVPQAQPKGEVPRRSDPPPSAPSRGANPARPSPRVETVAMSEPPRRHVPRLDVSKVQLAPVASADPTVGLSGRAGIPGAATMAAANVLGENPAGSFTAAFSKLEDEPENSAIYNRIDEDDRKALRQFAETRSYNFGDNIIVEGEAADGVFILVEGRCRVVRKGGRAQEQPLAILETGDMFGEMAKPGDARTASVRASGAVKVLFLSYAALERVLKLRPKLRGWFSAAKEEREVASLIRSSPLFAELSEREIEGLVDAVVPVTASAGNLLYAEGDEHGPCYLVKFGRLRCVKSQEGGEPIAVAYPRDGHAFGLASCLHQAPREYAVETLTDTLLLAIAPKALKALYKSSPKFARSLDHHLAELDLTKPAPMPLDIAELSMVANLDGRPSLGPGAGGASGDRAPVSLLPKSLLPREEPEAPKGPPPGSVPAPTEQAPFASADGYFVKKPGRIKAFPYVRQVDETDCGVACIAMICRYYGKRISIGRIRLLAGASADGTSLGGLCRAANELGLAARSARVSTHNLDKLPVPAITHWQGYHWIVLLEVRADKVRVADPGIGDYWMPRETYLQNWNGFAALFDFTDAFKENVEDKPSFAWVRQYFQPYLRTLAIALSLSLVVSGLTMLLPVLSQVIVDRVIVDGAKDLLTTMLITLSTVFVVTSVARALQGYLMAFVAVRVDAAILDYLSRRLLALPLSYFATRRTGDIQRRLAGARELREMVVRSGVAGVLAVVQLAVALALMTLYSVKLTALFFAMTPLYLALMGLSAKIMKPLFAQLEEAYGKYSSDQLDALKGIESVKAASAEASFRDSLLDRFLQTSRQQFRADYTSLSYEGALQGVGYLSQVLFLWLGATLAINGEITIGGFVAFQSLVGMANGPIFTALGLWDESQRAQILFNRLADIFETTPEQGHDRSNLIPVRTLSGGVELRRVGFSYGGPEGKMIINKLDLKVQPGEMIAIVGRSGSGKTTLVKLLSGLLEPTEGSILFDGIDHRTLNYRDLRRRIGFVLQENHIFAGTILDNIAFGEEPVMERAVTAARAADAHGFISNLPLGYSTRIGETGIKLSGGQAQRIAIARALYKQPSLIIFDEATSALDTESERAIQANMASVFAGRTAFVIAHRLSTIRDADRIMVLERGEIVELGSHEELMQKRGLYYELVNKQVEQ